jgi:N-methylhydantoinase A
VKLLTTHDAPERALLRAVDLLLAQAALGHADIDVIVHGTTLATNALIERRGARTALLTTAGLRDVLELGDESRFDQYDIRIEKPTPLVPRPWRIGVPERIAADGAILQPIDRDAVLRAAAFFRAQGVQSVAIAFLHSYRNPVHERRAAEWLLDAMPGVWISLSCEVSPELREYQRFSTTAANAYVQPVVAGYLARLEQQLRDRGCAAPLCLMLSSGGITTVDTACRFPVRLVESGPAGGAVFAADIARLSAADRVVAFDMGGTTAKLCLIDDFLPHSAQSFEVGRVHRFRKGSGLPLRIPVVEMVEIGAGGGSIARRDGAGRIAVGPHSAGSAPGPACYGNGGTEPTVTDADLLLGRLDAAGFAGGSLPLDPARASAAMAQLASGEEVALAISEIVDEAMASAARVHAVEQGIAIGGRTMIAFGGAAPLHAARVAEKLDIARIVIPKDAAVGSAVGFLRAPIAYEISQSSRHLLSELDTDAINTLLAEMSATVHAVVAVAAGDAAREETRTAFARYVGQGADIAIKLPPRPLTPQDASALLEDFSANYRALYSAIVPNLPIEILTWRVRVAAGRAAASPPCPPAADPPPLARSMQMRHMTDAQTGARHAVPVYDRASLTPGSSLRGPAIITERDTTTIVTRHFHLHVDDNFSLVLTRSLPSHAAPAP